MSAPVSIQFRLLNGFVAAIFLISAAIQLNDPDPAAWVAMYGLAAVACLIWPRTPKPWLPPAIVAAVALTWAATYASAIPGMAFSDMFQAMKAERPAIEEAREMLGLLIIAGWMVVLAIRAPRG
jgi:hypothetical protein